MKTAALNEQKDSKTTKVAISPSAGVGNNQLKILEIIVFLAHNFLLS